MESVGQMIKKARLAKGLTMVQLAELLGCTKAAAYCWEKDEAYPMPVFRKRLNEVLELNLGTKRQ